MADILKVKSIRKLMENGSYIDGNKGRKNNGSDRYDESRLMDVMCCIFSRPVVYSYFAKIDTTRKEDGSPFSDEDFQSFLPDGLNAFPDELRLADMVEDVSKLVDSTLRIAALFNANPTLPNMKRDLEDIVRRTLLDDAGSASLGRSAEKVAERMIELYSKNWDAVQNPDSFKGIWPTDALEEVMVPEEAGALSQGELHRILSGGNDERPSIFPEEGGVLSQDEIDKLLSGGSLDDVGRPAAGSVSDIGELELSDDEIPADEEDEHSSGVDMHTDGHLDFGNLEVLEDEDEPPADEDDGRPAGGSAPDVGGLDGGFSLLDEEFVPDGGSMPGDSSAGAAAGTPPDERNMRHAGMEEHLGGDHVMEHIALAAHSIVPPGTLSLKSSEAREWGSITFRNGDENFAFFPGDDSYARIGGEFHFTGTTPKDKTEDMENGRAPMSKVVLSHRRENKLSDSSEAVDTSIKGLLDFMANQVGDGERFELRFNLKPESAAAFIARFKAMKKADIEAKRAGVEGADDSSITNCAQIRINGIILRAADFEDDSIDMRRKFEDEVAAIALSTAAAGRGV